MADSKLIIESGSQEQETVVVSGSTSKPNLVAALRRPLSSYNIYFQLERKRLLNGDAVRTFTLKDAIELCVEQNFKRSEPKPKRLHRKTHGKISFQQMARAIADSWKALDENQRQVFEDCATLERKRYLKEKDDLLKSRFDNLRSVSSSEQGVEMEVKPAVPSAEKKAKVISSMPIAEDEKRLSGTRSISRCASVDNDSMMNELVEPVDCTQRIQEDEDDVFYQTHQNLLHNLKIINERQMSLRKMELSLKIMIHRHLRMQIQSERRRKRIVNSLTTPKVEHISIAKATFHKAPMMSNEALRKKPPMKTYGHGSIKLNNGMDSGDDYVYGLVDGIFAK